VFAVAAIPLAKAIAAAVGAATVKGLAVAGTTKGALVIGGATLTGYAGYRLHQSDIDLGNIYLAAPPVRQIQLENSGLTDNSKAATREQLDYQKRQESLARAAGAQDVSNHQQNMQNNNSDGNENSNPKRSPNTNIGKVVLGTGIGTAIGVQLRNPDPSKDANEARMEQLQQQNQPNQQNQNQNNNEQEKPVWQLWGR